MLHFANDSIVADVSATRSTFIFMACQAKTAVYGIQEDLDVHKMLDSVHSLAEEMQQCGEVNWKKWHQSEWTMNFERWPQYSAPPRSLEIAVDFETKDVQNVRFCHNKGAGERRGSAGQHVGQGQ